MIEAADAAEHVAEEHRHPDHHLVVWADTATLSVRVDRHDWLLPPGHGLWVPAGVAHGGTVVRAGRVVHLELDAAHRPDRWPEEPSALRVPPLARELLLHLDQPAADTPARASAEDLLLGVLEPVARTVVELPTPGDPRVRAVTDALLADPSSRRGLDAWADRVGTGVRTLTRLFVAETGLTFVEWRTRARVGAAAGLLVRGTSVGATARAVGYRSPGAFSAVFRDVTGHAPADYARHLDAQGNGRGQGQVRSVWGAEGAQASPDRR